MREVVFDVETTGLDPEKGDRIVEIGVVELNNHMPTGRTYQQYVNPQRDIPADAVAIHGLNAKFLGDKPVFREIGQGFLDFVADAKLVIHNAEFDMKFLNAELGWIGIPPVPYERTIDTLEIARKKFPGSPCTLDMLCRRFGIDNSARTLHGALLDAEILAEVYLELIGGRQPDFGLGGANAADVGEGVEEREWRPGPRPRPLQPRLTEEEKAAHAAFVDTLGDSPLWRKFAID